MELSIGKKIRALRQARELTQEELASHLGISFQSISKWERGDGYPDITMLPVLSRYFDVTIDELIGMEKLADRERYQKINKEWAENNKCGKHKENAELMRNSVKEYPSDPLLLVQLSTSLEKIEGTDEEKEKNLRQSIAIQEQIIQDADDCEVRGATLFNICFSYKKLGENEKALAQARKLPSLIKGRENALLYFLGEKEKREVASGAIMPLVWSFCHQLCALAAAEHDTAHLDQADAIIEMFYKDDDGRFASEVRKKVSDHRTRILNG